MCKSASTSGYCQQNRAVPLVCPLDIQGACNPSVFGYMLKHNEHTSMGLVNFSWKWDIEGSSLVLSMIIGCILTLITGLLIKHIKQRRKFGQWPKPFTGFPWWHGNHQPASPMQQPMLLPQMAVSPHVPTSLSRFVEKSPDHIHSLYVP